MVLVSGACVRYQRTIFTARLKFPAFAGGCSEWGRSGAGSEGGGGRGHGPGGVRHQRPPAHQCGPHGGAGQVPPIPCQEAAGRPPRDAAGTGRYHWCLRPPAPGAYTLSPTRARARAPVKLASAAGSTTAASSVHQEDAI